MPVGGQRRMLAEKKEILKVLIMWLSAMWPSRWK